MTYFAQRGAIAVCEQGFKGLITSEIPETVTYADGSEELAWKGVHMGPVHLGKPWMSRKPAVLQITNAQQFKALQLLLARGVRQRAERGSQPNRQAA